MIARSLVSLVVAALALLLLGDVLPGFNIDGVWSALGVAAVCGVINLAIWPLVIRLALPITVLTLGGAVLVLNGVVVLIAAWVVPGVEVRDVWSGVVVAFGVTAAATIAGSLLAIDDDARVQRHLIRRARRGGAGADDRPPGVLFLEIDGLAHEVLLRALRDGNAPTIARWVREGSHRLMRWETDWSSQTGACQAGLLHGNNDDMPAFRWWEKDGGRALVTNHPRDAAELERRISDGRGLLHDDGASRANILSGDAPHSLLTMSTVLEMRRGRLGQDYAAYFSSPYNMTRTVLAALTHVGRELVYATLQRRRDVQPRIKRTLSYAPARAWATAVQRDLQVSAVVADAHAGRPVVYTTFLAYDEVAHHSGIERPDTLAVLRDVDRQIAHIAAAAAAAPRRYEIVVLSDHGQTQGGTFLDRYGHTLEQIVREACQTEDVDASGSGEDEALGRLGAALTEAGAGEGLGARTVRTATRRRRVGGEVRFGDEKHQDDGAPRRKEAPEVVVMASGCLGLISFPRIPGRVTLEQIEEHYPRLLSALREHDGIGFALVRSAARGPVVLGAAGARWLDADEVEGDDPLAGFGPNAADHVRRTDGFAHCPDIVVNSRFWHQTEEVAAFEELVGSHGGMGGSQAYPFVLAPTDWALPSDALVGAETMHRWMRRWLGDLGQPAFAADAGGARLPAA